MIPCASTTARIYKSASAGVSNVKPQIRRTLRLNVARSAGLRVSALAMTGTRLTLELKRFMTSISKGFKVWPVGLMK